MPEKRKRQRAQDWQHIIKTGAVPRDDSDDELGFEDLPWEWIYASRDDAAKDADGDIVMDVVKSKKVHGNIIGARHGNFKVSIGDAVLLKAAGNEAWVALVTGFSEGKMEDEDGEMVMTKKLKALWFLSERELTNNRLKRNDGLENELYISASTDENPLETINGKACIMSPQAYASMFPTGQVPRTHKYNGKVFICRRGCNDRTTTYTDEFIWEDVMKGPEDLPVLTSMIEANTLKTRKRKRPTKVLQATSQQGATPEQAGSVTSTPKKRRKIQPTTPSASDENVQASPSKTLTPANRKIVNKRSLDLTHLTTRMTPSATPKTALYEDDVDVQSTVASTPLPCREKEYSQIYSYLESAISTASGSIIYVSGTPGTGKTQTVRRVVAALQEALSNDEIDDFTFVELNGMEVMDPHRTYAKLWKALKGQHVSPSHALELLNREFSTPSPRRTPCVVLMDELDQLVTRNQAVMYNFFNWPQLRHSRLIVLAVANTMDLPERTLSNKISSRLGLARIVFSSYTYQQLSKIVECRLEGVSTVEVDADAVQFAGRKVAAVCGDARRAMDVCRRAVEIAEHDMAEADATEQQLNMVEDETEIAATGTPTKKKSKAHAPKQTTVAPPVVPLRKGAIKIATIKRAIHDALNTPLAVSLRGQPLLSKVLLGGLVTRLRRIGIWAAWKGDVLAETRRLALTCESAAADKYLLAADAGANEREWLASFPEDDRLDKGGDGAAGAGPAAGGAGATGLLGTPGRRGRPAIKREPGKRARLRRVGLAAYRLVEGGLVGVEMKRTARVGRMRLAVMEEHVRGALRDDNECRGFGFDA